MPRSWLYRNHLSSDDGYAHDPELQALKFGVLVGVGGVVPSETAGIWLGDVVVSIPRGRFQSVVA